MSLLPNVREYYEQLIQTEESRLSNREKISMRLTEKNPDVLRRIGEIDKLCFSVSERATPSILEREFNDGEVFIYRFCNLIRGYALVNRRPIQPFLLSIAVEPEWQGAGIATKLLKEIGEHYKSLGDHWIDLTVNVNNPAQKLYFDNGWRVIQVMRHYYGPEAGPRENGLRMRRML